MSARRKLTDEQVEQLLELRERGRSFDQLAAQFGVSSGAIHYQCLRHGAIAPGQRARVVPIRPAVFSTSDGRTQRRFTQAEDRRLQELALSGMSTSAIARTLGRPRTSVAIRIMTIAQHQELAEGASL